MRPHPALPAGSSLLIDEYFASGDQRFLAEVLECPNASKLKNLAARWYGDRRPLLRQLLLDYIDDGCDRPFHRPLVKQLFKFAEAGQDEEAMAHFLVAFDRLISHRLEKRTRYDWKTRESWQEFRRKDTTAAVGRCPKRDRPKRGTLLPLFSTPPHVTPGISRFSLRTRRYLRRRVFRAFRNTGKKNPGAYRQAIMRALVLYEDRHLDTPEKLLDSWSLVHALYGRSAILVRSPRGIRIRPGHSLKELTPSPMRPEAWEGCPDDLLSLLAAARSLTVRLFAISMLTADTSFSLKDVPFERIRKLLLSEYEDVEEYGVRILKETPVLSTLGVADWLPLFEIPSPVALLEICSLAKQYLSPERLDLAQCAGLARSHAAPAAEMGAAWACEKRVESSEDLQALLTLRDAPVPKVRMVMARHILSQLPGLAFSKPEHLRDLADSRFADVRAAAGAFLGSRPALAADPQFWVQLSESPYSDVREFLIGVLEKDPGRVCGASLPPLFATALLSVHRGWRARQKALSEISERVVRQPGEASALLPLAGLLLRSTRPPERRQAMSALIRVAARRPELLPLIREAIGGFLLSGEVSA